MKSCGERSSRLNPRKDLAAELASSGKSSSSSTSQMCCSFPSRRSRIALLSLFAVATLLGAAVTNGTSLFDTEVVGGNAARGGDNSSFPTDAEFRFGDSSPTYDDYAAAANYPRVRKQNLKNGGNRPVSSRDSNPADSDSGGKVVADESSSIYTIRTDSNPLVDERPMMPDFPGVGTRNADGLERASLFDQLPRSFSASSSSSSSPRSRQETQRPRENVSTKSSSSPSLFEAERRRHRDYPASYNAGAREEVGFNRFLTSSVNGDEYADVVVTTEDSSPFRQPDDTFSSDSETRRWTSRYEPSSRRTSSLFDNGDMRLASSSNVDVDRRVHGGNSGFRNYRERPIQTNRRFSEEIRSDTEPPRALGRPEMSIRDHDGSSLFDGGQAKNFNDRRDEDERLAGDASDLVYYLYPPLDDPRERPGRPIRLGSLPDWYRDDDRYSYRGDPTTHEGREDNGRPGAQKPSSNHGGSREEDEATSSEGDSFVRGHNSDQQSSRGGSRYQQHTTRLGNRGRDDGPIVASINRDKGAVIHITLNQLPLKRKDEGPIRQRDEAPAPPAPPAPRATPGPPPAPMPPPFPFFGGYSPQQVQPQMNPTSRSDVSSHHHGQGYGGGGFIVLPQQGNKGGYYQPPLVIPLPPVYGGGHDHAGYATTTTTSTAGPPAETERDEPTATPPPPPIEHPEKDSHSVILITPSKAKASVSVAGKKIKGIGHHTYSEDPTPRHPVKSYSRPSYSAGLIEDDAGDFSGSSGSGSGGYGFAGRRIGYGGSRTSGNKGEKGKYLAIKAPTKRVKMYITPHDLEGMYGATNGSVHLPIEAVATVEGPTILIKQAQKAARTNPPARQSDPVQPPPRPRRAQTNIYRPSNNNDAQSTDSWRPVGPPGGPIASDAQTSTSGETTQTFTVPSASPGGKNYHYHFRITTNAQPGSAMPSVSMDALPPSGPMPPAQPAPAPPAFPPANIPTRPVQTFISYPAPPRQSDSTFSTAFVGQQQQQARVISFNPTPQVFASQGTALSSQPLVIFNPPATNTNGALLSSVFGPSVQQNPVTMMAQPPAPISRPSKTKGRRPSGHKGYGSYGAPPAMMDEPQNDPVDPTPPPSVVMPANLVFEPGLDVPTPLPPVHIHHFPKAEKKVKRKKKKPNKHKHSHHHHYDNSYRRRTGLMEDY